MFWKKASPYMYLIITFNYLNQTNWKVLINFGFIISFLLSVLQALCHPVQPEPLAALLVPSPYTKGPAEFFLKLLADRKSQLRPSGPRVPCSNNFLEFTTHSYSVNWRKIFKKGNLRC